MRNDVVSKQKSIDSLLEHNLNLLNYQCYRVIQDTQSNVWSGINTDVIDNYSNLIIMELILTLMTKPIHKPPLMKRMIKQHCIEVTMIVTWLNDSPRIAQW